MWILLRRWWLYHLLPYPLGSNLVKTTIGGVNPPTEHFPVNMTGLGENMNVRNKDIAKILNHKYMTGRPISFKIKTDKWHKIISDRRYGAFGEIYVTGTFFAKIGDLKPLDLYVLGYSSVDEYLAEPFNKGLTRDSIKMFICWNEFKPNWDVLEKLGFKQADYR